MAAAAAAVHAGMSRAIAQSLIAMPTSASSAAATAAPSSAASASPAAGSAPASVPSLSSSITGEKQCPPRSPCDPLDSDCSNDATQQVEAVLLKVLELEEIDTNMYRGFSPPVPRWGRVYGGQTCAQALVASCRTVDPRFIVHSLHSYFLRPGDDNHPILYYVERLRNGYSFASRRVTALQKGQAIFTQTVSFMTEEAGLTHQDPMPDVPPPERIQSLMDSYKSLVNDDRIPGKIKSSLNRSLNFPFPIDLRQVTPTSLEERLGNSLPPVQRSWFRVQGHLGNSLMLHQCALAYLSDWSLLGTSLLPHQLHHWVPKDSDTVLQMASIDHAMWFHHAFRADEWMLYDMTSPAASNGRGFSTGRFFDRRGKLIVSTAQEGLIRVRSKKADAAKAAAKGIKPPVAGFAGILKKDATPTAAAAAAAARAPAPQHQQPQAQPPIERPLVITKKWTTPGLGSDGTVDSGAALQGQEQLQSKL